MWMDLLGRESQPRTARQPLPLKTLVLTYFVESWHGFRINQRPETIWVAGRSVESSHAAQRAELRCEYVPPTPLLGKSTLTTIDRELFNPTRNLSYRRITNPLSDDDTYSLLASTPRRP